MFLPLFSRFEYADGHGDDSEDVDWENGEEIGREGGQDSDTLEREEEDEPEERRVRANTTVQLLCWCIFNPVDHLIFRWGFAFVCRTFFRPWCIAR